MTIWVHITAYQDRDALARVLQHVEAQTRTPDSLRIADNSPQLLPLPPLSSTTEHLHFPANIGTAGTINDTLRASRDAKIDYLWLLDQDSQPAPALLQDLLDAHAALLITESPLIGIVAPLTRNRDDAHPNRPLRFDRYRTRPVPYDKLPVVCDFLPASGMLLHLPSLKNLKPPSTLYFLDLYDFALGLAVQKSGASVWMIPSLELSHQIGRKIIRYTPAGPRVFTDSPPFRVHLLHRNTTYLFTRSARGHYRILAAAWQLRHAILHARCFLQYGFDQGWAKAFAALNGWLFGLIQLRPRSQQDDKKGPSFGTSEPLSSPTRSS